MLLAVDFNDEERPCHCLRFVAGLCLLSYLITGWSNEVKEGLRGSLQSLPGHLHPFSESSRSQPPKLHSL